MPGSPRGSPCTRGAGCAVAAEPVSERAFEPTPRPASERATSPLAASLGTTPGILLSGTAVGSRSRPADLAVLAAGLAAPGSGSVPGGPAVSRADWPTAFPALPSYSDCG